MVQLGVGAPDARDFAMAVRVHRADSAIEAPDDVPVVALHGLTGAGTTWDVLGTALAKRGRRTIAPDLRGHAGTDRRGPYTFEQTTEDVVALLDRLDVPLVDLVGHSLGGLLATRVAMQQPDRVRRLVVEDLPAPWGGPPEHDGDRVRRWRGRNATLTAYALAAGVKNRQRHYQVAAVDRLLVAFGRRDPQWWAGLPQIRASTLVIAGGAGSHVPQSPMTTMARLIPDAHLELVDVGHRVHSTDPDRFAALVVPFLCGEPRDVSP